MSILYTAFVLFKRTESNSKDLPYDPPIDSIWFLLQVNFKSSRDQSHSMASARVL